MSCPSVYDFSYIPLSEYCYLAGCRDFNLPLDDNREPNPCRMIYFIITPLGLGLDLIFCPFRFTRYQCQKEHLRNISVNRNQVQPIIDTVPNICLESDITEEESEV